MEDFLKLKIITPEKILFEDKVDYIEVPGLDGDMGIYPNHIALMSGLRIGILKALKEEKQFPFSVSGGFIQVMNDEISVLADTSENVDEIDEERAKEAKTRAEERLQKAENEKNDHQRAQFALLRAENRLRLLLFREEQGN